jgi:hypothetical protein
MEQIQLAGLNFNCTKTSNWRDDVLCLRFFLANCITGDSKGALAVPELLRDLSSMSKFTAKFVRKPSPPIEFVGARRPGYNPLLRKYEQKMPFQLARSPSARVSNFRKPSRGPRHRLTRRSSAVIYCAMQPGRASRPAADQRESAA